MEDLIGLAFQGESVERIRSGVEPLLLDIWDAEDWDAIIRQPKLLDNDDPEELALWAQMLAAPTPVE